MGIRWVTLAALALMSVASGAPAIAETTYGRFALVPAVPSIESGGQMSIYVQSTNTLRFDEFQREVFACVDIAAPPRSEFGCERIGVTMSDLVAAHASGRIPTTTYTCDASGCADPVSSSVTINVSWIAVFPPIPDCPSADASTTAVYAGAARTARASANATSATLGAFAAADAPGCLGVLTRSTSPI